MQSLVIFGAGNIGRGFIAPLFSAAAYGVTFIDLDQQRIDALNAESQYLVHEVFQQQRKSITVAPVQGILAKDEELVATAIAEADVLACAVGLNAVKFLAAGIAQGLGQRWSQDPRRALDILVCENGIEAADILSQAVLAALPQSLRASSRELFGCVRTSIGRMIPPNSDALSLDITVEPYAYLPCDAAAFCAAAPQVTGLDCVKNFDLQIHKKLYLHNCTHACLAYLGAQRGYRSIPECAADNELIAIVRSCGQEIIAALVCVHGPSCRTGCEDLLEDLLQRYTNEALSDTVLRVCRDPLRKLAAGDRFLGAAALCVKYDIKCPQLFAAIDAACQYQIEEDDPASCQWRELQAQGTDVLLSELSALPMDDALMLAFKDYYKK
ncbi:MAG: hypothetical protein HRU15_03330 [Planctomycetes bacterium]|nr:hypothetical protein [Planctomycetota bacterium]